MRYGRKEIKMGKYFRKTDFSDEDSKIIALYYIANELAEANRLKRIELEISLFLAICDKDESMRESYQRKLQSQLKDQA